jgi:hypothetical protein
VFCLGPRKPRSDAISDHRAPNSARSVNELEACFVVKDSSGQKLAYVYYEDEPGRKLLF